MISKVTYVLKEWWLSHFKTKNETEAYMNKWINDNISYHNGEFILIKEDIDDGG